MDTSATTQRHGPKDLAPHGRRICELAERSAAAEDPIEALRTLSELRRELEVFVREQVRRALAAGRSFGDVARALGISRQAAHQRFRDLAPERPRDRVRELAATAAVRRVVRLARMEALAAGAAPASDHVLLAILGTDGDAARALEAEGVTLEAARACVATTDDAGDRSDTASMRRLLKEAGRIALAREQSRLDPTHLLLAALADPDGGAARAVTALGVQPAGIRSRLGCEAS
jgi:ATP-dependent Clp protease ATP-binding subunit ClpA